MATHFLNNIRINDEYTLPSTDGTDKQIIVTDGAGVLSFDDLGTVTQSVTGVQSNFTYYEVKNSSGAAIPEFTGVMAVGTDGNSGHILIDEMVADGSVEPRYFLGVTQDGGIANGAIGRVVAFGEIDQINTAGFTDGDVLWCDPSTPGGFTITEPDGPNLKIPAAIVLNAATNGKIQVRVQANEGIHTLHDTAISSQANGDLLQWNSSTGVWENKTLASIADSRYVNVTGDTMTGGLQIDYASGTNPLLKLYNTYNGSGSIIEFSDQTDQTQVGTITYYHSDSASQSGGASFWFQSEPDTVLVVGNSTNKGRFASYSQNSTSEVDYGFGGNVNTGMYTPGANQVGLVAGGSRKLLVNSSGVSIQNGGLTVDNGDITLNGTGRIQGVDTVSAGTDAANKTYVDNAVSPLMTSFNLEADTGNQAISNGEKIVVTGGFGIATTLTVPAANTNEVTIDLARGLTTVTKALDTFAINLSSGENFLLNASGTYYITLTIASSNVGQSGTIVINNTAATSAQPLPSYMLTPEGATLDWVNTSGAVSLISYFVLATDKVLCNYVGNFQ